MPDPVMTRIHHGNCKWRPGVSCDRVASLIGKPRWACEPQGLVLYRSFYLLPATDPEVARWAMPKPPSSGGRVFQLDIPAPRTWGALGALASRRLEPMRPAVCWSCHTQARRWLGIKEKRGEPKPCKRGKTPRWWAEGSTNPAPRHNHTLHLCSAVSGEVIPLPTMGGNQSVPKITARDRAILE